MSNFLNLNWKDILNAIVLAVISAVGAYVLDLVSVFSIDWKQLVDIAVSTAIGSLLVSLGTTQTGKFLGGVPIK